MTTGIEPPDLKRKHAAALEVQTQLVIEAMNIVLCLERLIADDRLAQEEGRVHHELQFASFEITREMAAETLLDMGKMAILLNHFESLLLVADEHLQPERVAQVHGVYGRLMLSTFSGFSALHRNMLRH